LLYSDIVMQINYYYYYYYYMSAHSVGRVLAPVPRLHVATCATQPFIVGQQCQPTK